MAYLCNPYEGTKVTFKSVHHLDSGRSLFYSVHFDIKPTETYVMSLISSTCQGLKTVPDIQTSQKHAQLSILVFNLAAKIILENQQGFM